MNGTVFDIRRFSTHDGDGIRTTVFLKGCPLSCVWCQNPEGISRKRRPLYFPNRCIGCETCINSCKSGGLYKKGGHIVLDHLAEEDWDTLIDQCPTGAIEMDSQVISTEALMEEIRKDLVFFHHGGGVTLSGGEPLLQWKFAKEILKQCKKEGIHTAIETALYVPQKTLEEIVPYVDLVFADLKLVDEEKHKRYVGTSNIQIKDNIKWLLTSKQKDRVVIRTPMIPSLTATRKNIEEIARFISEIYPETTYEILNYNPLAKAKYHLVGKEYCFMKNPSKYSSEKMDQFGNWARWAGVKNIIIES